jgi:hypothetical protein
MLNKKVPFTGPVEAGVISFKNLKSGLLKFTKKDKLGSYSNKITQISSEIIDSYEQELKNLILELFDSKVDFTEKDV